MKYFVKGFEWVHWKNLEVHPDAKVPITEEDAGALKRSVKEEGLIQPLLVIPKENTTKGRKDEGRCVLCDDKGFCTNQKMQGGGFRCFHCEDFKADGDKSPPAKKFWIVDGANRFAASQKGPADVLPCVVVELHEGASVRDLALECASVGRSRSAGQRIMVYLERHKEKVLAASEKGQILKNGYFAAPAVSRDTAVDSQGFDSVSISKALGVSNKDTLLAIELLKSHERREGVSGVVGGLKEEGKKLEEGCAELKAIDETWAGVLAGTTPIRRWKAAAGGKTATKEVRRAEVSWYDVGKKALASLRGLGGHWEGLAMEDRMELLQLVREAAAALPREVREGFAP